jgi:hypothetical protein
MSFGIIASERLLRLTQTAAKSCHEKAGMSQVCFSLSVCSSFLWIPCIRARPPLSPSFHPHSWSSDCRSVHVGRSQFSRCCYLIIDLGSRLSMEVGPGLSRSHLISAVELGCLDLFLSSCLSLIFHREISSQDRLATTTTNSVDPQHTPFCGQLFPLGHRVHRFVAIAQ